MLRLKDVEAYTTRHVLQAQSYQMLLIKRARNSVFLFFLVGYSINEDHSLAKTAVGTPGYTGKEATSRTHILFSKYFHS